MNELYPIIRRPRRPLIQDPKPVEAPKVEPTTTGAKKEKEDETITPTPVVDH